MAEEVLEGKGRAHLIFSEYEDRMVSIFNYDEGFPLEEEVFPAWEKLLVLLEEFFSLTVTIGMGLSSMNFIRKQLNRLERQLRILKVRHQKI